VAFLHPSEASKATAHASPLSPMATASSSNTHPPSSLTHDHDDDEFEDHDFDGDDEEDDGFDEGDDDDLEDGTNSPSQEARLEAVLRRLTAEEVRIHVHEVAIRGCSRTRRAAVEAAIGPDLARAATVRDLVRAAAAARDRLRGLGAFDAVAITLDAAPPGIPGSGRAVLVLVNVSEARGRATGELGVFAEPQVRIQLKMSAFFFCCFDLEIFGHRS
jgi:outer membrane protein insertion porin family